MCENLRAITLNFYVIFKHSTWLPQHKYSSFPKTAQQIEERCQPLGVLKKVRSFNPEISVRYDPALYQIIDGKGEDILARLKELIQVKGRGQARI